MLVYRQALFPTALLSGKRVQVLKIKLQHSIRCVQCPDFFGNRSRNDERIQSSLGLCAIQHNRT